MSNLILVVDDDHLLRMQMRALLEREGYAVVEAANGKQGLDVYTQLQPDMVLLDVMMPGMDGISCCYQLRNLLSGKDIPVLMITAIDDPASVERAFAAGATDYVSKPIQWFVLRQRVHRLLEASRTIEELRQQTEQARVQEVQLRMALEAAHMGTWEWDITTQQVTWSDNKETMFGLEKGSFDGTYENFINCLHPEDRDFVSYTIQQTVDGTGEYDIEFRAVMPDGSIRWMVSKGAAFRDSAGVAVKMSGVDLDITTRKQAELALEVKARQQSFLAELSQSALAGTDLNILMNSAVTLVAESLQVEYCKVLELQPDGNSLLLTAGVGWHEGLVGIATVDAEINSQASYTLNSREPIVVEDLSTETRFQGPQLLEEHQVVSGMSVVIDGKERPFGVLGAHTSKQRHFSRDDIVFLQATANVLATAIERHRTQTALRESQTRLNLINTISTSITAGMNVEQVIENTVKQISDYFNTLRVVYGTIDADGKFTIIYSIEPPGMTPLTGLEADLSVAPTYLNTLRSSQIVIVEDVAKDTRLASLADVILAGGTKAFLDVSLQHLEQLVGLLCLDSPISRKWSTHEITTLTEVADYLAVAIREAQAQQALRESEERWQLALRGNNDGIWDWNVRTNDVFFSARWKEMLGYEEHEIGNHLDEWAKRTHPDDIGWVMEVIQDHFDQKTPFYISEHRVLCKDGSYKWILDRGQALWDEDGNVVRMAGSHTDITERKLAEQELERQNLRSQLFANITLKIRQSLQIDDILQTSVTEVQTLLHADRVLIVKLRPDGVIAVAEAVVPGFPVVMGKHIIDPCFQSDYTELYGQGRITAINDIYQAEIQPCHVELLERFAVKANLVVPILLQNQLWGLLIAHQCAHPRHWSEWETELLQQLADQIGVALAQAKLLEQETRQRQELARSNEELQQFAFVASHDLQEPLRKIKTFGDRLKVTCSDALTPQGRDYLERMQNAASRMQALIEDLLALSRVTSRGEPFVPVNLTHIVQEVISDLEIRIQQTGATVEVQDLPTINADPLQMRQLLQNLIGNALKFHRPETSPIVNIYSQDSQSQFNQLAGREYLQLFVEDNGIGFEEKYLQRIFNVFQRLHGRSQYEGTGIGLAICKKIVERHHGSITASSQLGQGATFIVTLPTH